MISRQHLSVSYDSSCGLSLFGSRIASFGTFSRCLVRRSRRSIGVSLGGFFGCFATFTSSLPTLAS